VSLNFIQNFYQENKSSIDDLSINKFTTDFLTGKKTKINCPKAKIIDMYGFNKSNFMITEKVFEILAESGGICINRQKNKTEEKFLYNHSEFDPTEEGLDINEKGVYLSFEKPFLLVNNKYPWYMLHIETIHEDYRKFIIEKLIEKLNEKSIKPDYLEYSKNQLEEKLGIKLIFKLNNGTANWNYDETD
jgi:hypothetical protein